ncbi:hypothetical protein DSO57_1000326 [Entomophthora muscae]|uniref:Uncharacterized protein n=1 Tax=Entomophthora muscae TaxID=34485 RepID=A0ACC2TKN5_9FUNG|nr:hypothetical protein DSO57_1000326 [Entomophthora muscae]
MVFSRWRIAPILLRLMQESGNYKAAAALVGVDPKPPTLRTEGLPARVSLGLIPRKLRPRMMAQMVKQSKPKESLHQMEE